MNSIFAIYSLSLDAQALICEDCYFTYEHTDNANGIGFYHNTTGDSFPANSEELHISEGAFWQIEKQWENQVVEMQLIPFADVSEQREESPSKP